MYIVQWNNYKHSPKNVSLTFNARKVLSARNVWLNWITSTSSSLPLGVEKDFPPNSNGKRFRRTYILARHWIPRYSRVTRQLPNFLLQRIKRHSLCSVVHLRSGRMHIDGRDMLSIRTSSRIPLYLSTVISLCLGIVTKRDLRSRLFFYLFCLSHDII